MRLSTQQLFILITVTSYKSQSKSKFNAKPGHMMCFLSQQTEWLWGRGVTRGTTSCSYRSCLSFLPFHIADFWKVYSFLSAESESYENLKTTRPQSYDSAWQVHLRSESFSAGTKWFKELLPFEMHMPANLLSTSKKKNSQLPIFVFKFQLIWNITY